MKNRTLLHIEAAFLEVKLRGYKQACTREVVPAYSRYYLTSVSCTHLDVYKRQDYDHLVDLGTTKRGDPVLMNKYVYDSDVAILIGHTQGNPYGGYSGGYKHCATGITILSLIHIFPQNPIK